MLSRSPILCTVEQLELAQKALAGRSIREPAGRSSPKLSDCARPYFRLIRGATLFAKLLVR